MIPCRHHRRRPCPRRAGGGDAGGPADDDSQTGVRMLSNESVLLRQTFTSISTYSDDLQYSLCSFRPEHAKLPPTLEPDTLREVARWVFARSGSRVACFGGGLRETGDAAAAAIVWSAFLASLTEVTAGVQLIPSCSSILPAADRLSLQLPTAAALATAANAASCTVQLSSCMRDATLDREYVAGALPQISALSQCAWRQPTLHLCRATSAHAWMAP